MSDPINDLIEGVWEAHGDGEAWVKLANAAQSQNQDLTREVQALQEENERLKVQLRYAARPTMGLPANTDPVEWARDHATDKAVRDALVTCIAGATLALSPTQETDPE